MAVELLAPGGSLQAALAGVEAGADAVYFGLRQFSARKGAVNLDLEELRCLKTACLSRQNKPPVRLYWAINTLLSQTELLPALQLAYQVNEIGIDGFILQDLGFSQLLKENFPKIHRHASTQLAVHNLWGAQELASQGFARIVLARELTNQEIQRIHEALPEVELEVFVHGALCYGVSGLCLASGMTLGRSANRGECAQLCRSWFETSGGKQYSLSMKDLRAEDRLPELKGVHSFKIEGRMKDAGYVSLVTGYYRKLLDQGRGAGKAPGTSPLDLTFSRAYTPGFGSEAGSLTTPDYSGPRGSLLGTSEARRGTRFRIKVREELNLHDGLAWWKAGEPEQTIRTGVRSISYQGKSVFKALPGQIVEIETQPVPEIGQEIRLVDRNSIKTVKPALPHPWRRGLTLHIKVETGRLTFKLSGFSLEGVLTKAFELDWQVSRNAQKWQDVVQTALQAPGDAQWEVAFWNWQTPEGFAGLFAPPSVLKELKRSLWAEVQAWFDAKLSAVSLKESKQVREFAGALFTDTDTSSWGEFTPVAQEDLQSSLLPKVIVLSPLQYDSEKDLQPLIEILKKTSDPHLVVLNNVGHFILADRLKDFTHIEFAAGYGLYCANYESWQFLVRRIPRLCILTFWIEGSTEQYEELKASLKKLESKIPRLLGQKEHGQPPLFLSRICPRKNSWGSCRDCTGNYTAQMKQKNVLWEVKAKHCLIEIRLASSLESSSESQILSFRPS